MTRNIDEAFKEATEFIDIIKKPVGTVSLEERQKIATETVENFRDYINKGFLEYRKSVTEAGEFAVTEWMGQGSILKDALDREFIDILGGFGLYS